MIGALRPAVSNTRLSETIGTTGSGTHIIIGSHISYRALLGLKGPFDPPGTVTGHSYVTVLM